MLEVTMLYKWIWSLTFSVFLGLDPFFFFFPIMLPLPPLISSSIYLFSHLFMKHNMKSYYPNWFLVKLKLFGRFKLVLLSTGSEITSIDVYHLKQ